MFAVATPLALLFVLELGLRAYYAVRTGSLAIPDKYRPVETLRFAPDAHMGTVLRPGTSYTVNEQQISINALGFRGPEVALPKPPGELRIACLGGSTTFDTRVSRDELTWPERLETLLEERWPERAFEVVNCGVPGYTTAETLANLALRVVELEPDLVIVYHAWNDIKPGQHPGFRGDYSHWRKPLRERDRGPIARVLYHSLLKLKLERTLRKARGRAEKRRAVLAAAPDGELAPEALFAFERNLESISGICAAHGIRLALCSFATRSSQFDEPTNDFRSPYTPRLSAARLQEAFRRCSEVAERVARERGALWIDVRAALPLGEPTFADYVHLSDAGAARMAEVVLEALERQGALEPH